MKDHWGEKKEKYGRQHVKEGKKEGTGGGTRKNIS